MDAKRIKYIDNLKILLIALVIIGHISVTYGSVGFWYYYERAISISSSILSFFTSFLQTFLIGLFLLIAAYFIPASYKGKKPDTYILGRLKRLGLPLVFYILFIGPFVLYLNEIIINRNNINFFRYYNFLIFDNGIINVGPLWFLEMLLIFTISYLIIREAKNYFFNFKTKTLDFPSNLKIFIFIIIVSLLSFTIRIWFPIETAIGNIQLSFAFQYIILFSIGIIAYYNKWFDKITYRIASFWLKASLIALPMWVLIAISSNALSGDIRLLAGGLNWQSLAYCFWENIVGIGIIINLIYFFKRKFNYQNSILEKLSKSAYSALIIHPLIIVPLSYFLRDININIMAKFILIAIIGVPLCFILGNYIRKIPGLKSIL